MNPTPHPVNPTSSRPQWDGLEHKKRRTNVGHLKDRNLEKMLCESPPFLFFLSNSLKAKRTSVEACSHFLPITFFWQLLKQSHCLSLNGGVVAHLKLSHLLSLWVSWAQGVWDVAVCWGRGKLCENCVGEAKKNITAWQQCCREWRTRRRSRRGCRGKGEWSAWAWVWQRGGRSVCLCVRVCV